jgi:sec-independent protein translocase protein TatA
MGLGGFSLGHLIVVLIIVMLIFGTKKLRNLGGDLGSAIKNFRGAMKSGEEDEDETAPKPAEKLQHTADTAPTGTVKEKDKTAS